MKEGWEVEELGPGLVRDASARAPAAQTRLAHADALARRRWLRRQCRACRERTWPTCSAWQRRWAIRGGRAARANPGAWPCLRTCSRRGREGRKLGASAHGLAHGLSACVQQTCACASSRLRAQMASEVMKGMSAEDMDSMQKMATQAAAGGANGAGPLAQRTARAAGRPWPQSL